MPTEHDTPTTPNLAPDTAAVALESGQWTDDTDPTEGAAHIDGEATLRDWEGLPPEAMILIPTFAAPMRLPEKTWAMVVLAVGIIDAEPDQAGEVELFAGSWVPERPPADLYDGDLVVRLSPRAITRDKNKPQWRDTSADVEMLLAHQGRWQCVGRWCALNERWPITVAPTAAAVMGLHNDAAEEIARRGATPSVASSPYRWARGGVAELLEAGLLTMGDVVVWNRRNLGVRHTARICVDGTLILADGRFYASPSGATTALSGSHHNGWSAFRLESDGRTLGDLRTELQARRGQ
jgi:RAMA domain-containing protein